MAERVPSALRNALRLATAPIPEGDDHHGLRARSKRLILQASKSLPERVRGWMTYFTVEDLGELLAPEYAQHATVPFVGAPYANALDRARGGDVTNALLY